MKRLMAIAALALAPLGCVANQGDAPIRFLWARALEFNEDTGCSGSGEDIISGGSIDISGGQSYLLAMSVETNNLSQPIIINQETFSGGGLGDITLSEIVYSYAFQPISEGLTVSGLPADEEERLPLYSVVRPLTNPEGSFIFMEAFGPKALDVLEASIPVGGQGTLFATLKARGRLSGGQTVESNEFTFPITVFKSGASYVCTAPQVPSGVCRNGQDVSRLGCVTP